MRGPRASPERVRHPPCTRTSSSQTSGPWTAIANRTHAGGYVAAGVGGGITGKGAHILLIIDDPLKNAEEADSADTREKLWDWYGSTAYTRLAPGGGVLVVQTHGGTTTTWPGGFRAGHGRADPDADQFVVVVYPAIAEEDEYLDDETDLIVYDDCARPENGRLLRLKGDALHPERYDAVTKLEQDQEARSRPRFWAALYQQNPVPDDGAYFTKDQFQLNGPVPDLAKTVTGLHRVGLRHQREEGQNDYTVGTVRAAGRARTCCTWPIVVRFKSGDGLFICRGYP
jgi:hypothetical protein